jgi:hypothetical protein
MHANGMLYRWNYCSRLKIWRGIFVFEPVE